MVSREPLFIFLAPPVFLDKPETRLTRILFRSQEIVKDKKGPFFVWLEGVDLLFWYAAKVGSFVSNSLKLFRSYNLAQEGEDHRFIS